MSKIDWHKVASSRIVRSAAQGFLVGAGLGSYQGDFVLLSLDAVASGLLGAVSMAILSFVSYLAFPPDPSPPDIVEEP